jgi:hypothetical protein
VSAGMFGSGTGSLWIVTFDPSKITAEIVVRKRFCRSGLFREYGLGLIPFICAIVSTTSRSNRFSRIDCRRLQRLEHR